MRYPTEKQSIYLEQLESTLLNSITAVLYDTSGQRNNHVIKRRYPMPMTNDDVQTIINAINKFTAMNKPMLWKRIMKEEVEDAEWESYIGAYRTIMRYYDVPTDAEIYRGYADFHRKQK